MSESDDDASVKAEWDTEIDARVKEVEESRVELVFADEAIARVRARLCGSSGWVHDGCMKTTPFHGNQRGL